MGIILWLLNLPVFVVLIGFFSISAFGSSILGGVAGMTAKGINRGCRAIGSKFSQ